jgi:hypothetical protein
LLLILTMDREFRYQLVEESLEPLLRELWELNAATPSKWRAGDFHAHIEVGSDGFPWVQAKTGVLNIYWPSDRDPVELLRTSVPSLPEETTCPYWEADKYATIEFPPLDPAAMAQLIREILLELYHVHIEETLSTEIQRTS